MNLITPLLIAFTCFVGLHQAAAQASFAPATNYAVGNNPQSIIAALLDGDGKAGLICANWGDNTLSVLTNTGSGGFGSNSTYTVGSGPTSVVAADVNGDGNVDLICANSGDNSLSVLTNNRSGTLVTAGTYAVGSVGGGAQAVVAADVNGDGKVDLICANFGDGTLSVLTNNGNGGFQLASSPAAGLEPWSLAAADVNGDGKVDLICANFGDDTLSVLTNNGSGGFAPASTLATGYGLLSVTAADVNGDGNVDLITANQGRYPDYVGQLSVFTNNGSGRFALATSPGVGLGPWSVVAADVNGDGKLDLICVTPRGDSHGTLSVLTNDGSGSFEAAGSYGVPNGAECVIAADVNGDGKVDLISTGDSTLSVFVNTSIFPSAAFTPTLKIHPQGNGVVVSWPSASAGWSLQQNSDLTATNWSPSGYSGYGISDEGTNKSLTVAPTRSLFFRLLHP
jgi:hypothetical protein